MEISLGAYVLVRKTGINQIITQIARQLKFRDVTFQEEYVVLWEYISTSVEKVET